jgi:hypothetical protein
VTTLTRDRAVIQKPGHGRREAHAHGDDLRRYTYEDVFVDQRAMLGELRILLAPERHLELLPSSR